MSAARNVPMLLAAASLLAISDAAHAQTSAGPAVTVSPFVFPAELNVDDPIGALRYRGAVVIEGADEEENAFWGLSGLWVSPDGLRIAGTEGGIWLEGSLRYDANGNLSGFAIDRSGPLLDENGEPFTEDRDKDAEALDHDGRRYLVGFETHDRVLAYEDFGSRSVQLPLPPEALEGIPEGAGFSSIAHLPDGRTIALAELTRPRATRGWLMTGQGDGPIWLRPQERWLPVSLSSFPNGDLMVLEILLPEEGTANVTRLGRIAAADISIDGSMEPVEIATLQPPLTAARFEGAAIRTGPDGETLIYVIYNASPAVLFMFELLE